MTPAETRGRYIGDLLRVNTPTELERWLAAEMRAAKGAFREASPYVDKLSDMKTWVEALVDDDRLLAFAKIGAEKAIDAVAAAMSASATTPALVLGRAYLDALFTVIKSSFVLERGNIALQKAQDLARTTPDRIAAIIKPLGAGGSAIARFQIAGEAYALGLSLLKGYLTPSLIRDNPKLILGEVLTMRRKYQLVAEAGMPIYDLMATRVMLAEVRSAIRVGFGRYRATIESEAAAKGTLGTLRRHTAVVAHNLNHMRGLLDDGHDAASDRWMTSRIDDAAKDVEACLLVWLAVDRRHRTAIQAIDLYSELRNAA